MKKSLVNKFFATQYIQNWGEVYYSLKKGFVNFNFILDLYKEKKVLNFSEEKYIDLLLSIEESDFEALELIKKYIFNEDKIEIKHNELDIIEDNLQYIPDCYKHFWDNLFELHLLTEIIESKISIEDKLYKIYLNHSLVNYKTEWNTFIPFTNNNSSDAFEKLLDYVKAINKKLFIKA